MLIYAGIRWLRASDYMVSEAFSELNYDMFYVDAKAR